MDDSGRGGDDSPSDGRGRARAARAREAHEGRLVGRDARPLGGDGLRRPARGAPPRVEDRAAPVRDAETAPVERPPVERLRRVGERHRVQVVPGPEEDRRQVAQELEERRRLEHDGHGAEQEGLVVAVAVGLRPRRAQDEGRAERVAVVGPARVARRPAREPLAGRRGVVAVRRAEPVARRDLRGNRPTLTLVERARSVRRVRISASTIFEKSGTDLSRRGTMLNVLISAPAATTAATRCACGLKLTRRSTSRGRVRSARNAAPNAARLRPTAPTRASLEPPEARFRTDGRTHPRGPWAPGGSGGRGPRSRSRGPASSTPSRSGP